MSTSNATQSCVRNTRIFSLISLFLKLRPKQTSNIMRSIYLLLPLYQGAVLEKDVLVTSDPQEGFPRPPGYVNLDWIPGRWSSEEVSLKSSPRNRDGIADKESMRVHR